MPPRVFISHSSMDKNRFVIPFAEKLRASGIHPWVDLWEIKPGDSLVRKIFDDGLSQSDAVIVVVSDHSIEAPWVRAELDHAVILCVEEGIRLIPVVLGDCNVPEPLRTKLRVKITDLGSYENELVRIIDTLYEDANAPPVGKRPTYTEIPIPSVHGLRRSDVLVFKSLVEFTLDSGVKNPSLAQVLGATSQAGIPEPLVDDSVEALAVSHLLKAQRMPNDGTLRFIVLDSPAFLKYLQLFEDVERISAEVGALVVNDEVRDGDEIAERISLHPLLVYAFLENLGARGLLKVSSRGDGNAAFGKVVGILSVSPQYRRSIE